MRTAALLLSIALLLYAGACVALLVFQRTLIYYPQSKAYGAAADAMVLPVAGANLLVTVRPHAGPKALLYFGGNAEDVSASLAAFSKALPDHAIYLLHYRGYGGSSGKPTEELINADARALFDKVHRDHAEIALVGRSLGSGVALRLATERPARRLVLVTPYDSIQDIAAKQFPFFPVRWLLADKFESWRYAPAVRVPTRLLQAENDEIVPAASTGRLLAAFSDGVATRVIIRGTSHNSISDTPQYVDAIRASL